MTDDQECSLDRDKPWKKVECVDDRNSSRLVWVFGLLGALIAAGVLIWDAFGGRETTASKQPAASTSGAGSGSSASQQTSAPAAPAKPPSR